MGKHVSTRLRCQKGQMTVEFAVALPVMLAVAFVAMNALLWMSECAAFDNLAREAVRVCAAAPAYGQTASQAAEQVRAQLEASFSRDFEQVEVAAVPQAGGHVAYEASLYFYPTLFGRPFAQGVFGVHLKPVKHSLRVVMDAYKPGAVV